MKYYKKDDLIFRERKTKKSLINEFFTMESGIKITVSKNKININETVNVSFSWLKFDIEAGAYKNDEEKTDNIEVEIIKPDGEVFDTVNLSPGEELSFSSEETGEYLIKTVNQSVENAEIKVVVENA